MPEYLYPGVYLEEVDAGTHPIPGVSTTIDAVRLESLVAELGRMFRAQVPEWTDSNEADPKVTLLELFAWLAENLLYRTDGIPERARTAALRAAAALSRLAQPCSTAPGTLVRPSYFSGQLLDEASLQAEQNYHRDKLRRHNRMAHGCGIVSGLGVHVEPTTDPGGARIIVDPGYAIDSCGEEIAVGAGATLTAPSVGTATFVSLRFWERPCAMTSSSASGEPSATRVEEACVIGFAQAVQAPALALARLIRATGGWSVDPTFVPSRAGSTEAQQ